MSESTLSTTLTEIRLAIAHFLGIDVDPANWDADQTAIINLIIKRGLRQFYFPPPVLEITGKRTSVTRPAHEWSFLKPITTLDLIGSYITGTITVTENDATVLLTDGIWPSWTVEKGTLVVDNVEYTIATRTDDTQIELSEVWSLDTESEVDYT